MSYKGIIWKKSITVCCKLLSRYTRWDARENHECIKVVTSPAVIRSRYCAVEACGVSFTQNVLRDMLTQCGYMSIVCVCVVCVCVCVGGCVCVCVCVGCACGVCVCVCERAPVCVRARERASKGQMLRHASQKGVSKLSYIRDCNEMNLTAL